nr:MAG TPA: H-type lectin domain [Caudoviricetes sp.]
MNFGKNVPEWHAEGTEPPASLKQSGFEAGYKPPAAYFNWFWNRVSTCLTEIRNKLKGHVESTSNPHGVTASQIGLDKVDNTSDAEKSVKHASTSGTADKTKSSMTVRFNGGNTEGADKWTFDGSTARSVNITPSGIGASKSDLSNVDNAVFRSKASSAGATGLPVVAAESTDGVAYTATVPSVTELSNGLTIVIVPNKTSTATQATLNVNSLGAKEIRIPLSFNTAAMSTPKLSTFFTEGRPITVQFDAGYVSGGTWKTIDKQKTSAQDLYGTVPVESGGTGATNAAGARTNLGAVNKAGDTMTGQLNVPRIRVAGTNDYPTYEFKAKSQTDIAAMMQTGSTNMFGIYEYPKEFDGQSTRYYEGYLLPEPSKGLTANKNYKILTEKVPVSVAQGGTGATTKSAARKNLGIEIQVGVATNVGTTEKKITFPESFSGVPVVTANGKAQTSIRVYDITATGCTLVSGESGNTVQWQAIYMR